MKTLSAWAMLLLLVVVTNLNGQGSRKGRFSQSADPIWGENAGVIPAPDGKGAIVLNPPSLGKPEENHPVSVRWNGREYKTEIGRWVNSEVVWSRDSRAFFVTYSDGGLVGTYHTKVFYLADSGLRVVEPIRDGRTLFSPKCFAKEYPNVVGVEWIGKDASRLLIAVQVPPHSSCASMGTFKAFEINLPTGKVISAFDQLAAKRLFSDALGDSLRNADDKCVREPKTCVPQGLKLGDAVR